MGIKPMAIGGRPKEEGGHRDYHLTFDKLTSEAFEKLKAGNIDISPFIEQSLRAEIEKLDPGEVSPYVWQLETYLSLEAANALAENNPEKAKVLASMLVALKPFRVLAGRPPLDPKLFSIGESAHTNVNLENIQRLYEKIIELRLNPQQRYREDGTSYYYFGIWEIIAAMRILAEMHPKIKEEVFNAFKSSITRPFFGDNLEETDLEIMLRNIGGSLTSGELDKLIGRMGKVLGEIQSKSIDRTRNQ